MAVEAFALLQQRRLKPDLQTLSPFIQFYAASDNLAKATEFMGLLQGAGIKADAPVLNAMLEMSARLGLDENMLKIYQHALAETGEK